MSEWRGTGTHVMRTYAEGLYASAREATGWDLWAAPRPRDAVEIVATGPECLPFSRDLCDAAAVAWVLIALAKRAGQWAEGIDAELARRYRAAWEAREALAPAYRASLAKRTPPVDISVDEFTPEERAWFDADAAVRGALDDLRRGYP